MDRNPPIRPPDEQAAEAAVELHAAGVLAEHLSHLGTIQAVERAELVAQIHVLTEQARERIETRSRHHLRAVS